MDYYIILEEMSQATRKHRTQEMNITKWKKSISKCYILYDYNSNILEQNIWLFKRKEKSKEWLPEIKGEGGLSIQNTKDLGDSDSGHCSGYTTVVDMYHMLVLK